MKKAPALPLSWYFTPAELAHDWGVHPDRIIYYCDAGLVEPGVLVPKAALPMDCPGPAPHVCVLLSDYRAMEWQPVAGDRVAPLVGEFRAFQVDGDGFRNLTLRDCDHVFVSRAALVIPLDQREVIEALGAVAKPMNPTERNTLLCVIALLLRKVFPGQIGQPYAMAERISRDLELEGVSLSRQAIVTKIQSAQEALAVTV